MSRVFVVTLGQRPEAITVALDNLLDRHIHYDAIVVLHTAESSGIGDALKTLRQVLQEDYPQLRAFFHEICLRNGAPMLDVTNADTAEDYFYGVLDVLSDYRNQGYRQHMLISGGRKAMSTYAMIAANYVFTHEDDQVLVVLSDEKLVAAQGNFHVPPGKKHLVQIVRLPFRPARIAPGSDPRIAIGQRTTLRTQFLDSLSTEEMKVAQQFQTLHFPTNEEIARVLGKALGTINKQLEGIYMKMARVYNDAPLPADKRAVLREIMRG